MTDNTDVGLNTFVKQLITAYSRISYIDDKV